MPIVDKYDTQTAIELMRQHIDQKGWFDKVTADISAFSLPVEAAASGHLGTCKIAQGHT